MISIALPHFVNNSRHRADRMFALDHTWHNGFHRVGNRALPASVLSDIPCPTVRFCLSEHSLTSMRRFSLILHLGGQLAYERDNLTTREAPAARLIVLGASPSSGSLDLASKGSLLSLSLGTLKVSATRQPLPCCLINKGTVCISHG